ncbi:MAG: hypothetical protein GY953_23635 [bacterium]|nr:hypothetical protein [bacterium]
MSDSDNDTPGKGTATDAPRGASNSAGGPAAVSAGATDPDEAPGDQAASTLLRDYPDLASDSDEFATHSAEYWNRTSHEELKAYYDQIELFYRKILKEFFQQANASATEYRAYSRRHLETRRRMIVLTGLLALLNVAIANTTGQSLGTTGEWPRWLLLGVAHLPLFAALYATALTAYTSLEGLYGYAGRAQAFREVRELFLNSAREYEMLWNVNVRPFGFTAPACVNASIAYRKIVRKDIEVRGQAKELIKPPSEREQPSKAG